MSIETDAQKDLSLNPEDAENVIGGNRKRKAKRQAVHQAAAHAGPNINIQAPVTATSSPPVDDCADPGTMTPSDTAASGA